MPYQHHYDTDCVCHLCGFDGAEWAWWKHTDEGKASPEIRAPICPNSTLDAAIYDKVDQDDIWDDDDSWEYDLSLEEGI